MSYTPKNVRHFIFDRDTILRTNSELRFIAKNKGMVTRINGENVSFIDPKGYKISRIINKNSSKGLIFKIGDADDFYFGRQTGNMNVIRKLDGTFVIRNN